MDTSLVLARILGIMLVVVYGSFLLNHDFFRRVWNDMVQHPMGQLLSGFVTLLLGLIMIQMHNIWVMHWPVLITIFGWLLAVSGLMRVALPEQAVAVGKRMMDAKYATVVKVVAAVILLIGVFLTYMGFAA